MTQIVQASCSLSLTARLVCLIAASVSNQGLSMVGMSPCESD